METENRKALTLLSDEDSRQMMLFKHYETLLSYHNSFDELIERTKQYREQEHNEATWTLSTREL